MGLPLLLLSHSRSAQLQMAAERYHVELLWEAFADRAYDENGQLVKRGNEKAVHSSIESIVKQAQDIISNKQVRTHNQNTLNILCDSLCVHGDTPLAFEALRAIRKACF